MTTNRLPKSANFGTRGSDTGRPREVRLSLTAALLASLVVATLCQVGVAVGAPEEVADVLWWKRDRYAIADGPIARRAEWSNFDGLPGDEVLLGSGNGLRVDRRDGVTLWRYPSAPDDPLPYPLAATLIGDVDDDGTEDIAAWNNRDTLLTLSGRSGLELARVASPSKLPLLVYGAGEDLNSDESPDLVVTDRGTGLWAYSGDGLTQLWKQTLDLLTPLPHWANIAVGDADADGDTEVAYFRGPCGGPETPMVPSVEGWSIHLVDGRTGALDWVETLPPESPPAAVAIAEGKVLVDTMLPRSACPKHIDPTQTGRGMNAAPFPQAATQQVVLAFRGSDGRLIWQTVLPGPYRRYGEGFAVADLQGDGRKDLVVVASPYRVQAIQLVEQNPMGTFVVADAPLHTDTIHALDLDSGDQLWRHKVDPRTSDTYITMIPGPGGGVDVAYSAGMGDQVVFLSGGSGQVRWARSVPHGGEIRAQDLHGDGISEVAVDGARWRAGLSAADGSDLWRLAVAARASAAAPVPVGDGRPDLVVGDTGGAVTGYSADGSNEWQTFVGSGVSGLAATETRVLAVASEPIPGEAGSAHRAVVALDPRTGRIDWVHPFPSGDPSALHHVFADVDGDAVTDVIVETGAESGTDQPFGVAVRAVSGRTGAALWEHVFSPSVEDPFTGTNFISQMTVVDRTLVVITGSSTVVDIFVSGTGVGEPKHNVFGLDVETGSLRWAKAFGIGFNRWAQYMLFASPMSNGVLVAAGVDHSHPEDPTLTLTGISAVDGTGIWERDIPNEAFRLVTDSENIFLFRKDDPQNPKPLKVTVLGRDGEVTVVQDDALPAALAATLTKDGSLVYAGTLGVVELSSADLGQGELFVRRQVRLPARRYANNAGSALITDDPLVDQLLPFGEAGQYLFGFMGVGNSTAGFEGWVALREPWQ